MAYYANRFCMYSGFFGSMWRAGKVGVALLVQIARALDRPFRLDVHIRRFQKYSQSRGDGRLVEAAP